MNDVKTEKKKKRWIRWPVEFDLVARAGLAPPLQGDIVI
jgi:hypothetical protein